MSKQTQPNDWKWVENNINSCETIEQLEIAKRLINTFLEKWKNKLNINLISLIIDSYADKKTELFIKKCMQYNFDTI